MVSAMYSLLLTDRLSSSMRRVIPALIGAIALLPVVANATVSAQGGTTIACGTPIQGDLPVSGEVDVYQFDGEAGDTVWLSLTETQQSDSGFAPQATVHRPDGAILANLYGTDPVVLTLGQTGRYTLRVYDSGGDRGSYRLRLEWLAPVNKQCITQPIGCGTPVIGALDNNDQNLWIFEGAAGDTVWLSLTETQQIDSGFAPQVAVHRPDGAIQAYLYGTDPVVLTLGTGGPPPFNVSPHQHFEIRTQPNGTDLSLFACR